MNPFKFFAKYKKLVFQTSVNFLFGKMFFSGNYEKLVIF